MKWVRMTAAASVIALMCAVLSGCLYPKDRLEQNKKPPKDAILNVQAVVDQYQKDTGLLPIKNSDQNTPVYEKYVIDFGKLKRMNYISSLPATAFESGGSYYYLIIHEETDPTVKLMNLVMYQQVNDLQHAVDDYKAAHNRQLPAGETAYPDFHYIDFDALDEKQPDFTSVFSGQTLAPMVDALGNVYLDYGPDIAQQIGKLASKPDEKQDLRELLVNSSDFVPVKAPIYRLVNDEPQAKLK